MALCNVLHFVEGPILDWAYIATQVVVSAYNDTHVHLLYVKSHALTKGINSLTEWWTGIYGHVSTHWTQIHTNYLSSVWVNKDNSGDQLSFWIYSCIEPYNQIFSLKHFFFNFSGFAWFQKVLSSKYYINIYLQSYHKSMNYKKFPPEIPPSTGRQLILNLPVVSRMGFQ